MWPTPQFGSILRVIWTGWGTCPDDPQDRPKRGGSLVWTAGVPSRTRITLYKRQIRRCFGSGGAGFHSFGKRDGNLCEEFAKIPTPKPGPGGALEMSPQRPLGTVPDTRPGPSQNAQIRGFSGIWAFWGSKMMGAGPSFWGFWRPPKP